MKYKNNIIFLLSLIGVLVLIYAGSFIFTSEKVNRISSFYVWLDQKSSLTADRITISADERLIEFVKRNQGWFIIYAGHEFPARSVRIEDFIGIFTQRDLWQVRSTSAHNHESFGLVTDQADRVTVYSGNAVLLDVLVGYNSAFGNEACIRRVTDNEVRSGDNRIRTYISSAVNSWYELKLFSETESVQRLTVLKDNSEQQIFSLNNKKWEVTNVTEPDNAIIESYIRTLLSSEGDDFAGIITDFENFSVSASITAEFGNGIIERVNFSEPDENGRRLAYCDGREYVYSVPAWQSSRLFRELSDFETN